MNFKFKKKYGQNFLTDTNLLRAIVEDAGVQESDNVLEIGAGAGALTEQIAIATITPDEIAAKFGGQPFRVVANLPYYISTPIIFYLIESALPITSITVMLQKELADRICAAPNTKDYGGITVILGLYGTVSKCRDVPRTMFTPQPNVDSSILSIKINENRRTDIKDISKTVKMCFAMRRKTITNNLMHGLNLPRDRVEQVLSACGIDASARAESLDKERYIALTQSLKQQNLI